MRGRRQAGTTTIEFAVAATVLFLMVFGIFQTSLALYATHFVSDAAREATRYAIVRGSASCTNTPDLANCNATAGEIQTYVQSLGYPYAGNLTVTSTWPDSGSSCTPSVSPCNNPGNNVKAVVTYAFPLNLPFFSTTIHLTSTSEMIISQ